MPNEVTLQYFCAACGTPATAIYVAGDRQYGDLPPCARGCEVPYAVMDAVADWLDSRAMQGEGESVRASRADHCGHDERLARWG